MNNQYEKLMENQIDDIDAAMFSGDTFLDTEVVADFRAMMARWDKRLKVYEELMYTLPEYPDNFIED